LAVNAYVAAADTEIVKDQVGSTSTHYASVKCAPVLFHYVVEDM
jgi:hypothetical protein